MKRILVYIMVLLSAFMLSAGEVDVAALRGPTSMGLVKLMEESENGLTDNSYSFTLEGAPDAIVPLLVKGDIDAAAIPGNLASVLYKERYIPQERDRPLNMLFSIFSLPMVLRLERMCSSSGKASMPNAWRPSRLTRMDARCFLSHLPRQR